VTSPEEAGVLNGVLIAYHSGTITVGWAAALLVEPSRQSRRGATGPRNLGRRRQRRINLRFGI
jgi:hypothetical protein